MSTTTDYREHIRRLVAKAAGKQAAVDACDGHIWRPDHISQISARGNSAVCVRCGERRGWTMIGQNEQWVNQGA